MYVCAATLDLLCVLLVAACMAIPITDVPRIQHSFSRKDVVVRGRYLA